MYCDDQSTGPTCADTSWQPLPGVNGAGLEMFGQWSLQLVVQPESWYAPPVQEAAPGEQSHGVQSRTSVVTALAKCSSAQPAGQGSAPA